jgi:hypothetical protein
MATRRGLGELQRQDHGCFSELVTSGMGITDVISGNRLSEARIAASSLS